MENQNINQNPIQEPPINPTPPPIIPSPPITPEPENIKPKGKSKTIAIVVVVFIVIIVAIFIIISLSGGNNGGPSSPSQEVNNGNKQAISTKWENLPQGCDMAVLIQEGDEWISYFNGKRMMEAHSASVKLSNGNIAIVKREGDNYRVFYNEKDMGLISSGSVQLSGDNILFSKIVDGKYHVFYNGKDMGEGKYSRISGDHIAFTREIDDKPHMFYDGRDLGPGTDPQMYGEDFLYRKYVAEEDKYHFILNGSVILKTDPNSGEEVVLVGGELVYSNDRNIIYKGKEVGKVGDTSSIKVSGDNIVLTSKEHIIYNGEDMGEGRYYFLEGDNIAIAKMIEGGNYEIFYNGKSMGKGDPYSIQVANNQIAFNRYNGQGKYEAILDGNVIESDANINIFDGFTVLTRFGIDGINSIMINNQKVLEAYQLKISAIVCK